MIAAVTDPPVAATASQGRRTLWGTGINHALHDGYADLTYVLLPVWQQEFGLDYAALALVRALFAGALAGLQIPSTKLAQRLGTRNVLLLGTLVSAVGYALAGASGGLIGLCAALLLAGAGSSTQHPLASAMISRTFGRGARGPLSTYNFSGDIGKAIVPPLLGLLLTLMNWRSALWLIAGLGVLVVVIVAPLLPRDAAQRAARPEKAAPKAPRADAASARHGFPLLVAIGMLDNAARPAFLLYLPFVLQQKGAALTTVGLALSLAAIGGALGKAVCGRLGARLGVTPTVLVTETGTALAILAVIALPLLPALMLLPILGVMLSGTSSVLYGTVPELAPGGRVERAFGIFYTCTLGSSALAMPLFYGRLGDAVGPSWAAVAAAVTALAVVPIMLALSPSLPKGAGPHG
jgi:MFS family permease